VYVLTVPGALFSAARCSRNDAMSHPGPHWLDWYAATSPVTLVPSATTIGTARRVDGGQLMKSALREP
jgi:hypothetical protein